MDRTQLLSRVSSASSLNQISSVMAGIREWLVEHPDDEDMRDAFQGLARLEREHWIYTRA